MSHHVILSSLFCTDEYPGNQGCEFTNVLNHPLKNFGSVALSELIYEPDFWQNIRAPFNKFKIHLGEFDTMLLRYDYLTLIHVSIATTSHFPEDPNKAFSTEVAIHFGETTGTPSRWIYPVT